jgi:hypothetical protein
MTINQKLIAFSLQHQAIAWVLKELEAQGSVNSATADYEAGTITVKGIYPGTKLKLTIKGEFVS